MGKERRRQPLGEELVECEPVPGETREACRERLVGQPAPLPLPGVLDPRVRPDEDEPLHELRSREGRVQNDAAPHRVPEIRRPASRLDNAAPGFVEIPGAGRGRTPVAGQVDRHDLVMAGEPAARLVARSARFG